MRYSVASWLLLDAISNVAVSARRKSASSVSAKTFALVVGNARYTKINQLENPLNDAPDMAEALVQQLGQQPWEVSRELMTRGK